jgi:hypothetical protein
MRSSEVKFRSRGAPPPIPVTAIPVTSSWHDNGMRVDGRKLSHAKLEEIRFEAVRRVQGGEAPTTVARAMGLYTNRIFIWLAAYRSGGWQALRARKAMGRPDMSAAIVSSLPAGSLARGDFSFVLSTPRDSLRRRCASLTCVLVDTYASEIQLRLLGLSLQLAKL